MSKNKNTKKYILIGSLIFLLGGLSVFAYNILYNSGMVLKETNTIEVMNKLKDIHGKGGKFELTQKDIDELSSLLKPKTEGNLAFSGLNIEIIDDEILLEAPITYNSYKKVRVLFSSKGKLNVTNGKITYVPDNFKIGKVTLPTKLVMSQVKKLNNENIYAQDNSIKIDQSVTPLKINSFKIKDDKILVTSSPKVTETASPKVTETSSENINNTNNQELLVLNEEVKASGNNVVAVSEDSTRNTSRTPSRGTQEVNETKQASLIKVQEDLSDAYQQVDTSKERKVISEMKSTVSKMEANPSYNATKDKDTVKSKYEKLDDASQDRIKAALITNVDQDNLGQLIKAFGL